MARKKAVPTEDIPAVTQLFTPHWIVRYLVENSLGRLWLLNRPSSKLREQMPYYIEGEEETDFLRISKPEEIKLLDPACGSGHMLTYAFDLLTLIYEEEGYAPTEIPALILRHNLHGLEICPRAAQLAELALVFKAREQSRRFFQPDQLLRPQILELQNVRFDGEELNVYIEALGLGELFDQSLFKLLRQFEEAKTFGSLIQPAMDGRSLEFVREAIEAKDLGGQLFLRETHSKLLRVLEQAQALTQRQHVVVANPPYMGGKQMGTALKEYGQQHFPDSKSDTFAMFIELGLRLVQPKGFSALVTMQSWMFLSSYQALRLSVLANQYINMLIQIGYNSFPELNSKVVQACAFVLERTRRGSRSVFVNLNDAPQTADKEQVFKTKLETGEVRRLHQTIFAKIPSSPIAFMLSEKILDLFPNNKVLGDNFTARQGLATTENALFVRSWHEVSHSHIGFGLDSQMATIECQEIWFPYNKGGEFRKWWGNQHYIVNWRNDGADIKSAIVSKYPYLKGNPNFVAKNQEFYFRESVSFSKVGSSFPSFKKFPTGFIFDVAGSSIFASSENDRIQVLSFCNTIIARAILAGLAPTLNIEIQQIESLPLSLRSEWPELKAIVDELVQIARADWDNFETSWDFLDQPLLRPGMKGLALEASWRNWEAQSTAAIRRMQELETENNRLLIAAYGLDGELQPEVPEDQITLARAEARTDVAALLSYGVGCMMGRYSPDQPGLIIANAGDSLREFLEKVGKPLAELTFAPDEDGIIPVLDGEWFEDDIVARSREFLVATFPCSPLAENLRFIETVLGKDIRKYFCTDFYKDHLQTYKKRPIYWLVQSPKKGFACLIYLHRYTKDTLNLVLNNYLRPFLLKLEARQHQLELDQLNEALPAKKRTAGRKELEKIAKVLRECQDWEREALLPLAQQRISLDLDDGVKVNYLKLTGVLAPIPGLAAKEDS